MKVKTSVTLSEEVLRELDESGEVRSRVIETAVTEYLARRRRQQRDARDLEILNRRSEDLNRELAEVLPYQAEP